MSHQDGLLRLDDSDTGLTLFQGGRKVVSTSGHAASRGRGCGIHVFFLPYLSCVDTPLLDAGDDEPLTSDVDSLGVSLVDGVAGAVQDADEALHLGGLEL